MNIKYYLFELFVIMSNDILIVYINDINYTRCLMVISLYLIFDIYKIYYNCKKIKEDIRHTNALLTYITRDISLINNKLRLQRSSSH